MQPKFVELETELILAVERVLLIPSSSFDGAVGPKFCHDLGFVMYDVIVTRSLYSVGLVVTWP